MVASVRRKNGRSLQIDGDKSIPMATLDSRNIRAAGCHPGTRTLRLRYVGGRTYEYLDVPGDVYDDFVAAPGS